jgi:hypothetical protein
MNRRKVILRKLNGEILKGFLEEIPSWDGADCLTITSLTEEALQVPKAEIKALFFVKRFSGAKEHSEVRFFDTHPKIDGLWVRATFKDGEVIEGIVANNFDFFSQEGFYIKPPDPNTNNRIVYVLKSALTDLTVLAVQYSKKNIADFHDYFQQPKESEAEVMD